MTFKNLPILAIIAIFSTSALAQSSKIYHKLEKLKVLGSALYVAAHPDDENTRMISHLSNDRKARTVYLSLTRGDGGQNLIGTQLGPQLGVIRTQELLAARRIDGGEQFFSRANDFGYSKTPDETLEIWENEKVLADVVWAIRKFRPDVIINRFNHEKSRRTHGHHTASAMLSYKAFDLAADETVFPEQLKYVDAWQPERLYFNTSWWFYGSYEKFEEADKTNMAEIDIGGYYPVLGASNNEIAAQSRSMHKCQGFGAELQRGSQMEYLQHLLGSRPNEKNDIFHGINTSWSRVKGGEGIAKKIDAILNKFNVSHPSSIVNDLLNLRKEIASIKDDYWREVKMRDLDEIIMDCLGLYTGLTTSQEELISGQDIQWEAEWVNRSPVPVEVTEIVPKGMTLDTNFSLILTNNQKIILERKSVINTNQPTSPYWINEKATLGMYHVEDQTMIGLPETPSAVGLEMKLIINGQTIQHFVPLRHKHIDPVKGEITTMAPVSTGLSLSFEEDITMFRPGEQKTIFVSCQAYKEVHTDIGLKGGDGWKIEPESYHLELSAGQNERLSFTIQAPAAADRLKFEAYELGKEEKSKTEIRIEYDHIPTQQIIKPAEAEFICSEIQFPNVRIGYIDGAGDKVDESLQQVGYSVTQISAENLAIVDLSQFDVLIVGIRAFNTKEALKNTNRNLFEFAEKGGTVIVQYNTTRGLVTDEVAPYHIELSRGRVTDENSPVEFLTPEHQVLNTPNKIALSDFDGWVQERGLYFPSQWDEHFIAPLSMHDPNEENLAGSLLVAPYGQGYYVYTGISWFRELPAGVEGAYKLFANLLALSQKPRP